MENDGPIPVSVANTMIQDYTQYMQVQGIDMDKQTQSVSFTRDKLMDWLTKTMPDADELRICLGAYGKDDISNPGRITVILWPYKNGEPTTQTVYEGKDAPPPPPPPTPPYNQGTLNP